MEPKIHQHLSVFLCLCQTTFELSVNRIAGGAPATMVRFVRIPTVTSVPRDQRSLGAVVSPSLIVLMTVTPCAPCGVTVVNGMLDAEV